MVSNDVIIKLGSETQRRKESLILLLSYIWVCFERFKG